jgi:hypothetical protein
VKANLVEAILCFAAVDSPEQPVRNSNKIIFCKIITIYCEGNDIAVMIYVVASIL